MQRFFLISILDYEVERGDITRKSLILFFVSFPFEENMKENVDIWSETLHVVNGRGSLVAIRPDQNTSELIRAPGKKHSK